LTAPSSERPEEMKQPTAIAAEHMGRPHAQSVAGATVAS
jgi:hypothetical protein